MTEKRDPATIPHHERSNYTSEGEYIPFIDRRSPWGPPVPGRAPHADQHVDDNGFGVPDRKK